MTPADNTRSQTAVDKPLVIEEPTPSGISLYIDYTQNNYQYRKYNQKPTEEDEDMETKLTESKHGADYNGGEERFKECFEPIIDEVRNEKIKLNYIYVISKKIDKRTFIKVGVSDKSDGWNRLGNAQTFLIPGLENIGYKLHFLFMYKDQRWDVQTRDYVDNRTAYTDTKISTAIEQALHNFLRTTFPTFTMTFPSKRVSEWYLPERIDRISNSYDDFFKYIKKFISLQQPLPDKVFEFTHRLSTKDDAPIPKNREIPMVENITAEFHNRKLKRSLKILDKYAKNFLAKKRGDPMPIDQIDIEPTGHNATLNAKVRTERTKGNKKVFETSLKGTKFKIKENEYTITKINYKKEKDTLYEMAQTFWVQVQWTPMGRTRNSKLIPRTPILLVDGGHSIPGQPIVDISKKSKDEQWSYTLTDIIGYEFHIYDMLAYLNRNNKLPANLKTNYNWYKDRFKNLIKAEHIVHKRNRGMVVIDTKKKNPEDFLHDNFVGKKFIDPDHENVTYIVESIDYVLEKAEWTIAAKCVPTNTPKTAVYYDVKEATKLIQDYDKAIQDPIKTQNKTTRKIIAKQTKKRGTRIAPKTTLRTQKTKSEQRTRRLQKTKNERKTMRAEAIKTRRKKTTSKNDFTIVKKVGTKLKKTVLDEGDAANALIKLSKS